MQLNRGGVLTREKLTREKLMREKPPLHLLLRLDGVTRAGATQRGALGLAPPGCAGPPPVVWAVEALAVRDHGLGFIRPLTSA